jgi:hypothetical protein
MADKVLICLMAERSQEQEFWGELKRKSLGTEGDDG